MTHELQWQSVLARDSKFDGKFVYAVRSTGVFCRPSCPSRRPRRDSVEFFGTVEDAARAGYRPCRRCCPQERNAQLSAIEAACKFIDNNIDGNLTLREIADQVALSPFYLHRLFKKTLGVTPQQYQQSRRLAEFKSALNKGSNITEAIYEAGYGSSSRLYEKAPTQLGMTPSAYRRKGEGIAIRYTIINTPLGKLLIAVTDKGICNIQFGDSVSELETAIKEQFNAASIRRDDHGLRPVSSRITEYLEGCEVRLDLDLDVQATAFQRRVWETLRDIPYGETRSYSEIAKKIGDSNAVRAVARACATNPVALVVPCHRVVQKSGELAGYRWGLERKRALLALERKK